MIHHRWRPSWNGTWLLIRPALQMPVIWKLPWTPTAPTKDFVIPCWKWKDLKDWSVFIRFLCLKDWQDMGKEGEGRREKKETWRLDWLGKKTKQKTNEFRFCRKELCARLQVPISQWRCSNRTLFHTRCCRALGCEDSQHWQGLDLGTRKVGQGILERWQNARSQHWTDSCSSSIWSKKQRCTLQILEDQERSSLLRLLLIRKMWRWKDMKRYGKMGYRDVRRVGCAVTVAVAKLRKPAKSAQRFSPRHMWHCVLANVLVPRRDARLSGRTKFSNTESTTLYN